MSFRMKPYNVSSWSWEETRKWEPELVVGRNGSTSGPITDSLLQSWTDFSSRFLRVRCLMKPCWFFLHFFRRSFFPPSKHVLAFHVRCCSHKQSGVVWVCAITLTRLQAIYFANDAPLESCRHANSFVVFSSQTISNCARKHDAKVDDSFVKQEPRIFYNLRCHFNRF